MNNKENILTLSFEENVIIGGGTMGLFLANKLIENKQKVIVIEAGNDNIAYFDSFSFSSVGQKHEGIAIGRAKALGGTSNLWGGQLTKFIENDLEELNRYNQPLWPIQWKELDYYCNRVLFEFNIKDTGEYKRKISSSNELEKYYTYWMYQPNFKVLYLNKLQKSPLFKLFSGAVVTDLEFTNDTCYSLTFIQKGKQYRINNFKNVILANGTFEQIRLLLKTKLNPNCPYKNNNLIGKYFQDHIYLTVGRIKNAEKKLITEFSNIIRDGNKLQPKIRYTPEKGDIIYIGLTAFFSFTSNLSDNIDLFKQFLKAIIGKDEKKLTLWNKIQMIPKVAKSFYVVFPIIYHYIINNRLYVPFSSNVSLNIQSQQISSIQSSIDIDMKALDNHGMPKIILDWKIDGREMDRIIFFCDIIKMYIEENNFGQVEFEPWINDYKVSKSNEWKKYIKDTYHQAGGAIMSTKPTEGVVDKNLRVHQTNNLFIVGPSVLPTSSYANTGLTSLALTLRLADHLTNTNSK